MLGKVHNPAGMTIKDSSVYYISSIAIAGLEIAARKLFAINESQSPSGLTLRK